VSSAASLHDRGDCLSVDVRWARCARAVRRAEDPRAHAEFSAAMDLGRPADTAWAENAVVTADGRTDDYELDSDLARMDLNRIHQWLSTDAYWALGRTRETVETAARHSLNFGVFLSDGTQVAYARVATDYATFGWLCDVYVDRDHRGRGLGRRLSEAVVATLRPMRLQRVLLATADAHKVYARVGFVPMPSPETLMILDEPDR
jgi:GNAT superfamily N-acetyltransferase